MGCMASKPNLIEDVQGGEEAYHDLYLEDKVVGEGQFGVVRMVHNMKDPSGKPLACKILKKGVTFRDNTLYPALKPEVLQQECEILRTLAGMHYCLELVGIYESPKAIYMVTEFCSGGEMMQYVSKQTELRSEDVSRIAYQLLDAVNHCDKFKIIHRDIKPENIMFKSVEAGSDLKLIDFGSGCIDQNRQEENLEMLTHTTFAGSAFYISPEMFQKTYTSKTDVWSVGAALYVLVAGYPADDLQKAFNILQKSKNRDIRSLPNLPEGMPESYYDMLNKLLTYRHKLRNSAGEILQKDEFVQFHKEHAESGLNVHDIAAEAASQSAPLFGSRGSMSRRTESVKVMGSVHKHGMFLGYQKYERSVTTLLATVLTKSEFVTLLMKLKETISSSEDVVTEVETTTAEGQNGKVEVKSNEQKLSVIPMEELKKILKDLGNNRTLNMVDGLPNSNIYNKFAYHVALLREFAPSMSGAAGGSASTAQNNGNFRKNSSQSGEKINRLMLDDSDHSNGRRNSSVHGHNVYNQWTSGRFNNPRKPGGMSKANSETVNNSWHHGS